MIGILLLSLAAAASKPTKPAKPAPAPASTVTAEAYGPYIVTQAFANLGSFLWPEDWRWIGGNPFTEKEVQYIIKPIVGVYEKASAAKVVGFKPGSDPVFQLHDGQPARTAVTGNEADSPIYFNLDVINNADLFSMSKAFDVLVHELGHKIDRDPWTDDGNPGDSRPIHIDQSEIDTVAGKFAKIAERYEMKDVTFDANDQPHTTYVYNYLHDFWNYNSDQDLAYRLPIVAYVVGEQILPLQDLLYRAALKKRSPKETYLDFYNEVFQCEPDYNSPSTNCLVSFRHRIDTKPNTEDVDYKFHAEESELAIDLTGTPKATLQTTALSESARYSVIPKLVLSEGESDSKQIVINGYVDFRSWAGVEAAKHYGSAVILEINGVRKSFPLDIVGGDYDQSNDLMRTVTFVVDVPFDHRKGVHVRFVAIRAEMATGYSSGQDPNIYYILPRRKFAVDVKAKK